MVIATCNNVVANFSNYGLKADFTGDACLSAVCAMCRPAGLPASRACWLAAVLLSLQFDGKKAELN